MTSRNKARKFAMQLIYQINGDPEFPKAPTELAPYNPQPLFPSFWAGTGESVDDEARLFTESRVMGFLEHRREIDALIEQHSAHWRLARMAPVDLCILRLAVFEICYSDIPVNIVINEAVDLAKQFSAAQAPKFVNGVLDAIAHSPSASAA